MKFISFTEPNGNTIYINPKHIICFKTTATSVAICLIDNVEVTLTEIDTNLAIKNIVEACNEL